MGGIKGRSALPVGKTAAPGREQPTIPWIGKGYAHSLQTEVHAVGQVERNPGGSTIIAGIQVIRSCRPPEMGIQKNNSPHCTPGKGLLLPGIPPIGGVQDNPLALAWCPAATTPRDPAILRRNETDIGQREAPCGRRQAGESGMVRSGHLQGGNDRILPRSGSAVGAMVSRPVPQPVKATITPKQIDAKQFPPADAPPQNPADLMQNTTSHSDIPERSEQFS